MLRHITEIIQESMPVSASYGRRSLSFGQSQATFDPYREFRSADSYRGKKQLGELVWFHLDKAVFMSSAYGIHVVFFF